MGDPVYGKNEGCLSAAMLVQGMSRRVLEVGQEREEVLESIPLSTLSDQELLELLQRSSSEPSSPSSSQGPAVKLEEEVVITLSDSEDENEFNSQKRIDSMDNVSSKGMTSAVTMTMILGNTNANVNASASDLPVSCTEKHECLRTCKKSASKEAAQWRKQEEEKELEAIKRSELDKLAEAKEQKLLDKGSPKDEKQEKMAELKNSDEKEQTEEKGAPPIEEEKTTVDVGVIPSYTVGFDPSFASAKSITAEEQQEKDKPAPQEDISLITPIVTSETVAANPSTQKEDVHHSSADSEQELPSSTIKTPDFTDNSSSTPGQKKELEKPPVFQSMLEMPELGKFNALFYNVSHNDGTLSGNVFPISPVPIIGRISPQSLWNYIDKVKKSKEVIVFRLAPASPEDEKMYMTYFTYWSSRERLAVMGGITYPLKDVYLIPLDKHHPVPPCLLPFRGPGLPQERTHLLLAVVIRHFPELGIGIGLKRKASAGSEAVKKQLKMAPSGARVLKSSSRNSPPIDQQVVPSPASMSGKGDDNELNSPRNDDVELAKSDL